MPANPPTVSVCIPTYNRKQLLKQALESVFAQTFTDYEVIVVDDGSTDDTFPMLSADYAGRIRAFRQPNAGDAAARNRAVREAEGKYLALLDSDDLWVPDKLERQVRLLNDQPDVHFVYSPKRTVDLAGREVHPPRRTLYRGRITPQLFQDIFIPTPSVVCRREAFQNIGFFNESLKVASDYEFWLRASTVYQFDYIGVPLVICRKHKGNLTGQQELTNQEVQFRMLEEFASSWRGTELLPAAVAARKLARETFKLARLYFRTGEKRLAHLYYRKSLAYRLHPRSVFGWLRSL